MTSKWEIQSIRNCLFDTKAKKLIYEVEWKNVWLNKKQLMTWKDEIHKIIDSKVIKKNNRKQILFLVQFEFSWIAEENLADCEEFVAAFALYTLKNYK